MPLLLSLKFREQVTLIDQTLANELDQLVASIAAAKVVTHSDARALISYIYQATHGGTLPTATQLDTEVALYESIRATSP